MEYVYILTNDFIPNCYKIGYTSRHPNLRASEINKATGVPGDWVVAHSWQVAEGYAMEQKIFNIFEKYRINRKEIFEIRDISFFEIKDKINNFLLKEDRQQQENEINNLKLRMKFRVIDFIKYDNNLIKNKYKKIWEIYFIVLLILAFFLYLEFDVFKLVGYYLFFGLIMFITFFIKLTNRQESLKSKFEKYYDAGKLPKEKYLLEKMDAELKDQLERMN